MVLDGAGDVCSLSVGVLQVAAPGDQGEHGFELSHAVSIQSDGREMAGDGERPASNLVHSCRLLLKTGMMTV